MSARIERLREGLEEPFLVTNPTNVFYLTGFRSSNAALLVDEERTQLFSDFRYAVAGRAVEGVDFVETSRALVRSLADLLSGRVAFEAEHLTYAAYETLASAGLDLVPRRGLVERLREVKDAGELERIREAAKLATAALVGTLEEGVVGRTERDFARRLEQALREAGAEDASFRAIVAAGAHGALPHAEPRDVEIPRGTLVVFDWGARLDGFCSDFTRTIATCERDGAA